MARQVPADGSDVFVHDRTTGATTRVSVDSAGNQGTGGSFARIGSYAASISGNGRFVAFVSDFTSFTGDGIGDVFVHDRSTGTTTDVTVATDGMPGSVGYSYRLAISGDGRYVAYDSSSVNLVSDDTNGARDVIVRDLVTSSTTRISLDAAGTQGDGDSFLSSISADGRYVAFVSSAANLVTGDTNGGSDVFVKDRTTGATTRVSVDWAGNQASAGLSDFAAPISEDGRYVAFTSSASTLVAGDTNGKSDVFVHDLTSHATTRVSVDSAGNQANNGSLGEGISGDGRYVAYSSDASNLVAGDANGFTDVFVGDRDAIPAVPAARGIGVFRPSNNTWYDRIGSTVPFGATGDVPVPCDYDGSGTTDTAVFRPSAGAWFIKDQPTVYLGLSGDVPVPADYDGDGDCDVAVFRPSIGGWYGLGGVTVYHGLSGDIPVPADYDGNGTADLMVFRPSVGGWYRFNGPTTFFGLSGDIPVPVDYDGNRASDLGVFRPTVGGWYVSGQTTQFLGLGGDIPVPADYDGNGVADRAVFRPATGAWYAGHQAPVFFGLSGDRPLPLPSAIRQAFFP